MRLSKDKINLLITALDIFMKGEVAELRLYGSRVNDLLKGGDVDLLILTERKELAEKLREKKHHLLSAIKKNLGDQKIDLAIADKRELNQDAFLKIFPESVLIKSWKSSQP
ncbi:MAG: nucleotidyltransferase domain-containing protein [Gammaproteobacteria bacterium]